MDSLGSAEDMVDSPSAVLAEASIGDVMKCCGFLTGFGCRHIIPTIVPSQYPNLVSGH